MRYDVKKFLFIGVEEDRDTFFKRAQEAGIIHFIDKTLKPTKEVPQALQQITLALKIMRGLPVVNQEEVDDYSFSDTIVPEIIRLKDDLDRLAEESRVINLEMTRVEPFGNFSLSEIAATEKQIHRKIQFYCAKLGFKEHHELPEEVIYITSDNGLDYFIGINPHPKQYPKMIEMIIDHPYEELKQREAQITKTSLDTERALKKYAKYKTFLHHAYIQKLNEYHLQAAKNFAEFPLPESGLFAVQGWVPNNKIIELNKLVEEMKIHVEEIDIDPKDAVPTCLENDGLARVGEDLVHIYDTPSTTDKDPSIWVLIFFSLFFSMIIGDGGYGLILLIIALYIRYKHSGLKGLKKRVLDLLTVLAFSCIVWGVLTTSFFGIPISPDNPIRKVSVMTWLVEKKAEYHIKKQDEVFHEWVKKYPDLEHVKNPAEFLLKASSPGHNGSHNYEAFGKFSDNILMELALFVGVLHIILSMGRYLLRNLQNVGWIIFLIGAYLYTPTFLGAASIVNFAFGVDKEGAADNALYLMYGGIALAVIIAIFKHKFLGLLEASNLIQIFGDVLSYLRLYALGLAGSLLTATMLDLAASVPFVLGLLIIILGHIVNITLGIMGGIIHGLRLNFLEWYHYSFEGGGKMFNPLKKQKIE